MREIPPFKSIIYFEAVARLNSFKLAAEELNVTPGAVSHQVAALEKYFGKELFDRNHKTFDLNHDGRKYYTVVSKILEEIEGASVELGIKEYGKTIKIAVPPSLLKNWLMPELFGSEILNDNVNFEFIDTLDNIDISANGLDIAIRYGYDTWDSYYASHLFNEEMVAVCSPKFYDNHNAEIFERDINNLTLIYTKNRLIQWDAIMNANFKSMKSMHIKKLIFQNSIQAIEAAINNAGIAYVNKILVKKELDSGRLLIPFTTSNLVRETPKYHLVSTYEKMQNPYTAFMFRFILEKATEIKNSY